MENLVHLRKAEDLYMFSCVHNLGKGLSRSWGLNSFRIVEQAMQEEEYAYLSFIGLHRFHSMSAHQRNYAYALTNRHLIMAKMRPFWRTTLEIVPLNEIRNLSVDSDNSIGVLKIVMEKETICVGMTQESAIALGKQLTELLPVIQKYAWQLSETETATNEELIEES